MLSYFPGVSDDTVLQLVYPYFWGPMAEFVSHVMYLVGSLDIFYTEALDYFVPGQLRKQLLQKYFYRV